MNEITHICSINACSHSGLIREARSIFESIQMKTEKIYVAMVILCMDMHLTNLRTIGRLF